MKIDYSKNPSYRLALHDGYFRGIEVAENNEVKIFFENIDYEKIVINLSNVVSLYILDYKSINRISEIYIYTPSELTIKLLHELGYSDLTNKDFERIINMMQKENMILLDLWPLVGCRLRIIGNALQVSTID